MLPVLLTRPAGQQAELAAALAAAGHQPHDFAPLALQPDTTALAQLPGLAAQADWLVFVSPSAIDIAWPALADTLASSTRLACVGRKSAERLAAASGRAVLFPPEGLDSEALLQLPELQAMAGLSVLIIRGESGRALLGDTLQARGAAVHYVAAYRSVAQAPDWALFDRLLARDGRLVIQISSSEITHALFASAGAERRTQLAAQTFCTFHPRIAATLATYGVQHCLHAADGSATALIESLAALG